MRLPRPVDRQSAWTLAEADRVDWVAHLAVAGNGTRLVTQLDLELRRTESVVRRAVVETTGQRRQQQAHAGKTTRFEQPYVEQTVVDTCARDSDDARRLVGAVAHEHQPRATAL